MVRLQVDVIPDFIDDPEELMEKLFVSAIVETFKVFFGFWHLHECHNNLGRFNNLFLDVLSIHADDSGQYTIENQCLVAHDFRAIESG